LRQLYRAAEQGKSVRNTCCGAMIDHGDGTGRTLLIAAARYGWNP
jgi:hypothetical protein